MAFRAEEEGNRGRRIRESDYRGLESQAEDSAFDGVGNREPSGSLARSNTTKVLF